MSNLALYRKYRPLTFSDVIGQEHITHTLTNQIKSGRISHAYLFTGSRGTGKTTCAKIFAKAVNCLTPVNGSPCGECGTCRVLSDANNIDILEIDAASNNKVDEIRDIREKVQYPPVTGKYKVYIIDEVHMLTDSAFNALLKTLEEPPSYVIFILATTEVHKLPATILSRCIRFDFRLVSASELSRHLAEVYKKENKAFEAAAVRFIAEQSEGSVRDCLSIADMCLNYAEGELKLTDVLDILGATDKNKISSLFNSIASSEIGKCLIEIDGLSNIGKSMSLIAKELTKYARDLLVLKTVGDTLLSDTKENIEKMKAAAQSCSVELLTSIIRIFSGIDAELRYSVSPKIVLEAAAIKAAKLFDADISALTERVRRLESEINNGEYSKSNGTGNQIETPDEKKNLSHVPDNDFKPMDAKSIWGRMTTYFRTKGVFKMYSLIGEHTDYKIENDKLIIFADNESYFQFCDADTINEINGALVSDNLNLTAVVEKKAAGVDMDKEIANMKKLAGNSKVNIIK